MNTKISMHRIIFMLYVVLMILLTWMPNINQIAILVSLWIWIMLYFSKKLKYTKNSFYVYSFLILFYISLYMNIPLAAASYEKSVIGLQALPYLLLWIIIFTLSLYKDFSKKQ